MNAAKELKGFSQVNATKELKALAWKNLVDLSHDKLKNELLNPIL